MDLFVAGFPIHMDNDDLENLVNPYGKVLSAKVIKDYDTGESRRFGFVKMADKDEANTAIKALNNHKLSGNSLTVNEARPKIRIEGEYS